MSARVSFSDFRSIMDEYLNEYRLNPNLEALEISGIYDLFPDQSSSDKDIQKAAAWPDRWSNSERPGIYAIFDASLELLYVGKASMGSYLGARLSSYFQGSPKEPCKVLHTWVNHEGETVTPRYVITVAVPKETPWEAPALEEYLIDQLKPPSNRMGIRTKSTG